MSQIRKTLIMIAFCTGALVFTTSSVAQQREFKGSDYVACLSEDLLDQFIDAAVQEDSRAMDYLLNNGCLAPRSGVPVSVLDSTWTGKVHVRAYVGDQAIELWTIREALTN